MGAVALEGYEIWDAAEHPFKRVAKRKIQYTDWSEVDEECGELCEIYMSEYPDAILIILPIMGGPPRHNVGAILKNVTRRFNKKRGDPPTLVAVPQDWA